MTEKFKVEFLPEAVDFMEALDGKTQKKIYFNIRKAQFVNDPELFKKTGKTPFAQIEKADRIRKQYFEQKK